MLEYILVGLGVSAAWAVGIYAAVHVNRARSALKDIDMKANAAIKDLEARLHTRLSTIEATLSARPEITSAASHVAEWLQAVDTLEPGSPKHEAFMTRLASLGVKKDA